MGVGGGLGGFKPPPQNPKYPSQTLGRLGASAKFWQKNVFLRPFWAIFRPASGIFRKVALPRFLELPTFECNVCFRYSKTLRVHMCWFYVTPNFHKWQNRIDNPIWRTFVRAAIVGLQQRAAKERQLDKQADVVDCGWRQLVPDNQLDELEAALMIRCVVDWLRKSHSVKHPSMVQHDGRTEATQFRAQVHNMWAIAITEPISQVSQELTSN